MKTVWKYTLDVLSETKLRVPAGARTLHVGAQEDVVCVWLIVDTEMSLVPRWYRLFGTGHALPEGFYDGTFGHHVGTAMLHGGAIVLHAFEVSP